MRQIDDPLLADRMHDLEDMSNRLLRIVSGQLASAAQAGLRRDTILIARNLGPAELLEYDRRRLKGVILEEGSLTAHVIIVARAMGIPVLGRVKDIRRLISDGDLLLVDVGQSALFVRPTPAMEEAFETQLAVTQKRRAVFAALKREPPVSKDGLRVTLMINAGLRDDIAALDATGADGIGLFRTEFQFLVSATMPQRERQLRLYRDVIEAAGKSLSSSELSTSAETRPSPTCARMTKTKKTQQWVGARSGSRWKTRWLDESPGTRID